jgi:BON domain-containing protein
MRRRQPLIAVAGAATGATAVLFLEPRGGARRRALLRDKLTHFMRILGRAFRRRTRWLSGRVRGMPYRAAHMAGRAGDPAIDSTELSHRVESELGRDPNLPLNSVNFDAIDNVIRIRGMVADEQTARRLVERVARVPGVDAVISLLHTPSGESVGGTAGDAGTLLWPRVRTHSDRVLNSLQQTWPFLTADDILASDGHPSRLAQRICAHTAEAEDEVRARLDRILFEQL